jgi:MFS family permease
MVAVSRGLVSRNFVFLVTGNLFLFLAYLSYQLLPLHIKALGGGETDIGWVMGAPNLMSVVLTPVFGIFVDRFGRKPFLLMGQCCVAVSCVGFLFSGDSFLLFAALRTVQNVGVGMAFTAGGVLVADTAQKGRLAQSLGVYGMFGMVAHALAPAIGEFVISAGGFYSLFVVTAAYGVLGLAFASRVTEAAPPVAGAGDSDSIWRVFTRTGFTQIMVLGFMNGAALGTVTTYVPTYIRSRGIQWISLFFITYTVTAILIRVGFGRLSDRLGHRRIIPPAFFVMLAGVCLLSQARAQWMFALAGVLNGISHGFLFPAINALALGRSGDGNFGKAQFLFAAAFSAGVTLGVFSHGVVADAFGYSAMFLSLAGWILVGLLIFLAWERRGRRASDV